MTDGSAEGPVEGAVDPDAAAEELYGLPRDDFVPRRNELVKQARAAGDRDSAAAIGELRKPSVAAWLANALAREYPDEVGGLEELGSSLREAQQRLEGDALRALSRQRHELIAALVARARRLAREDGVHVGETVVRELERTVAAALSDAGAARALAVGRLTGTLEPGSGLGDPAADDAGTAVATRTSARPTPRVRRPSARTGRGQTEQAEREQAEREQAEREQAEREQAERERAERQRAVEAAEEVVRQAGQRAEEAREAADAADRERAAATEEVEELRAQLSAAEAEQGRAEDRAATADEARAARDRELATADTELREARRRVDGL